MSLDNHKITTYQDNVSDLPDYPSDEGYTAKRLKEIFDGRGDKEIKEKHNALIDELAEILEQITKKLNAAIDSDDITLDQLSELVAYIKDNRSLIDAVTTAKANKADVYNRNAIDAMVGAKADIANVYYRGTIDAMLGGYATIKYAEGLVSGHNTSETAHSDIRSLISELTRRLNAVADSDDITLDQLSELVAYIKDNRSLIDAVTTAKANAADVYNRETIDKKLTERDNRISELEADVGDMDTALDSIIAGQESILAMQNALIGGDA